MQTSDGNSLHNLLLHQMKQAGLSPHVLPADLKKWHGLLGHVSRTYREAGQSHTRMEKSSNMSSDEVRCLDRAITEERDRITTIIQSLAEGLCSIDLEGNVTFLNAAAEKILGTEGIEVIGWPFRKVFQLGDLEAESALKRLRKGEILSAEEAELVCYGGRSVPVSYFMNPIVTDGNLTGAVLIIHDNTEAKRAEEALIKSQNLLARVLHNSLDGIMILRALRNRHDKIIDFNCLMINPAGERILGCTANGQKVLEMLPWLEKEGIIERFIDVIEVGEPFEKEFYYDNDGIKGWLHMIAYLVSDCLAVTFEDISERKDFEHQLWHSAFHDKLTDLPNRSHLLNRLDLSLKRAQREPDFTFALLFLDLDRFKVINDSLGHSAGDQLLIEITRRMVQVLRKSDNVFHRDLSNIARIGGDEFVILLEGIQDVKECQQVAERLQAVLKEPFIINGRDIFTSTSIGIVTSHAGYEKGGDMLRDADMAMYSAKAAGKARFKVFDRVMHDHAVKRLQLENDLRRALTEEQFELYYQPIFHLETMKIRGVEALIRWHHPERGILLPMEFISVAEETGLIDSIGQWVLTRACQQLQTWKTEHGFDPELSISVNVSKNQIAEGGLADVVARTLDGCTIDPRHLRLEITESVIMENESSISGILDEIKNLGVQLDMDNFGTGYSSLSCLHLYPFDMLKIDRLFMINLEENPEYAAIIQAVITIAHSLKMKVLVEGISLPDQLVQVQKLGCDYGQGLLFLKPLAEKEMRNRLSHAGTKLSGRPHIPPPGLLRESG